jgi:hypothetical protein
MTSDTIKNFNNIFESLLIQLSPTIGSSLSFNFKKITKYNAVLPIEQFLVYALPLRDKIISKDESYFLSNDDETLLFLDNKIKGSINLQEKIFNNNENVSPEKYKNAINEILRLQNIYEILDEESKNNIWNIFNALLILGEEYIKIKYSN